MGKWWEWWEREKVDGEVDRWEWSRFLVDYDDGCIMEEENKTFNISKVNSVYGGIWISIYVCMKKHGSFTQYLDTQDDDVDYGDDGDEMRVGVELELELGLELELELELFMEYWLVNCN
ncbi:predicted protein [Sclerotinia sclerotiorum 1980 UF-70]|uniref:Uncharacterized protein n=1 Tax=Sclerotinia sclerotiorum (strain ATCC 18683 / 1980 / Ss-1) TaxID=665079 RepID=A7EMP5_SCLS1|nr:predicted protein [Sclerotinia sclerotiorum 1980 UF-70]EDO04111.1 predicted protein [Sclerotinia sclerotiorum 1980 UF-70]